MAPRFLTILTGRNLPKIRQSREPEPSTINEKTVADFTRVVEQTGILERGESSIATTNSSSAPRRSDPQGIDNLPSRRRRVSMRVWLSGDDTQDGPATIRPGGPAEWLADGHVTCSVQCLSGECDRRMVDVRLDTLPQDQPWSRVGWCFVCKQCGAAGSVNIVPNWHDRATAFSVGRRALGG
jgi:hypothetical protein